MEYQTKIRLNLQTLSESIQELKSQYDEIGNRDTHEGRSRFSRWNNLDKFYNRILSGEIKSTDNVVTISGANKGNSARIYFKPSVTSLSKEIRKSIIPVNSNTEFAYFDLRAAEFAMNAIFAQETEAVKAYQNGEDIYMHYADIFPKGTSRKTIKTILIANMYNKSAYSTGIDLGISEAQAEILLNTVAKRIPKMTALKNKVISYCILHNGYFAPNGFDQTDLIKVADIDPKKGFNPAMALSAYTQSALGFFMQKLTLQLLPLCTGTLLSVFDSMLIEIRPESRERFSKWVLSHFSPLIPDKISFGKTFWDAAYTE